MSDAADRVNAALLEGLEPALQPPSYACFSFRTSILSI